MLDVVGMVVREQDALYFRHRYAVGGQFASYLFCSYADVDDDALVRIADVATVAGGA